jgi:site-specific DNA recombinase
VDEQHADHEADAQRQGWTLGEPYVDVSMSASRYARRARGDFEQLVADLAEGDFGAQILILWESSRGSRRVGEWVNLIEACERLGVSLWVHTHHRLYDPSNARDRRTLLEDAVDSEWEVAKGRDRTLRAKAASAVQGRPAGKVLYGHQREYDGRGRYVRTLIEPEAAAIVREAARRYGVEGETLYAIAADLRARGVPGRRGGDWTPGGVKKMVTTAAYAGLRQHRGEIVGPADWPAILDEATWAACVQRAGEPSPRESNTRLRYMLSGAVYCGVCGTALRTQVKYKGALRYVCDRPRRCVVVPLEWLDKIAEELVIGRMDREDALELLTPADDASTLAKAREELAELEARLEAYQDQAARGEITPTFAAGVERRLAPQIEDARRRSRAVTVSPVLRKLAGEGARARWADLTVAERRESVRLLLRVRVHPAKRRGRGSGMDPDRVEWDWLTP